MMKNYNFKTVCLLLMCAVFTSYGQNISFQVSVPSSYPSAGLELRIGGNAAFGLGTSTGWSGNRIVLTLGDDGLYTGTYTDIPEGPFLFGVYEGTEGANWGGDWISDATGLECSNNDNNYLYNVTADTNVTLSFVLNSCYVVSDGLILSNDSFDLVDFSVSPNPAEDFIKITTKEGVDAVSIYNLVGSKVLETATYSEEGGLDVSSLTAGVYVLVIESDGSKGTYKFIKK